MIPWSRIADAVMFGSGVCAMVCACALLVWLATVD